MAYDDFFSFSAKPDFKEYFDKTHALCHEPMSQLVRRYNLQGKSMLSVGTSFGIQEYCLYEHGCSLVLCDIDEGHGIEPYLQKLPAAAENYLTFVLGDARELDLQNKLDAVFFSGFTPNELRNAKIYGASNRVNRKLLRGWPTQEKPFDDTVIAITDRVVKDGGLLIYQSYGSGVDARDRHYVQGIRNQLGEIGMQVAAVYYFDSYPSVHLVMAVRGDALEYLKQVEKNPEITMFHGRGMAGVNFKGIKKVI